MDKLYTMILAGGRGERFWPLSTRKKPKQLLPIVSNKTMLEETINRLSFIDKERIFIIGTDLIKDSIEKLNLINSNHILSEPMGRNTALAIGYSAIKLRNIDPDSIMLVCPADHDIFTEKDFMETIKIGYDFALKDNLITFGITPTRPEVGYGYIELGENLLEEKVYRIKSFKEKPNLKTANSYLKKGNTLWNSGIFLWKTHTILQAIKEHLPEMYEKLLEFEKTINTEKEKDALFKLYNECNSISIDFGVMEQAKNIVIVKALFKWDDVGHWNALERIKRKNKHNNIEEGDVITIDSEDNIIYSQDGLIATIGVQDLVIVRTEKITLVCNKRDVNEIKNLLKQLDKDTKLNKYL